MSALLTVQYEYTRRRVMGLLIHNGNTILQIGKDLTELEARFKKAINLSLEIGEDNYTLRFAPLMETPMVAA